MKQAVKLYSVLVLAFMMLLFVSSSFGGVAGDILYCAAFVLPVLTAYPFLQRYRTEREEERGVREEFNTFLTLDRSGVRGFIPLVIPSVGVIFLVSVLTSLVMSLFNREPAAVADQGLLMMIAVHALIPAVLEELMFRYLPLKLLYPYSARQCVIISALYFALIHCDVYKIPYAFAAGIIFISIDIMFDSVLPSLILHFTNNLLSVIAMKYCSTAAASLIFAGTLAAVSAVSAVFIVKNRRLYKKRLQPIIRDKSSLGVTYAPLAVIIPTLCIALTDLFL